MDNKKKLTIGFFIGMIAVSATSLSFSIAWYASSSFLTVSPIDIEIETDRKILISTVDEKDAFKEQLSLDDGDLKYSGVFAPVSSICSDNWISSRAPTPIFYDCARVWNSANQPEMHSITRDDYYYYSQDFYLYSDGDAYITLDTEKTYIHPNQEYNNKYAPEMQKQFPNYSLETIKEKLNSLVKAMRISILVPDEDPNIYRHYVIDPNKAENDEEVLFGGVLDNGRTEYYDTYIDGGEKYETVYGDVNNRDLIVYDDVELADSVITGEPSAFNARHQQGTHKFNYAASVANGMEFAKENSISYSDLANNPSLIKFPVYKGYQNVRRIVFTIYIEGWDLRSINSTMGSAFIANLSFKIFREM